MNWEIARRGEREIARNQKGNIVEIENERRDWRGFAHRPV
jgi:hypothetical protein